MQASLLFTANCTRTTSFVDIITSGHTHELYRCMWFELKQILAKTKVKQKQIKAKTAIALTGLGIYRHAQ